MVADFVDEVDNDIVFLDAQPIEVLAHGQGELVFGLSLDLLLADHGGRV